jgi:hypothetical protein
MKKKLTTADQRFRHLEKRLSLLGFPFGIGLLVKRWLVLIAVIS